MTPSHKPQIGQRIDGVTITIHDNPVTLYKHDVGPARPPYVYCPNGHGPVLRGERCDRCGVRAW